MLEENTLLKDRYRIRHQIGKGGMGTVYLAKDENPGITIAIKQNFYEEPRLIEAFKREARLLASLRHPALPQVRDYFVDGAGQFLVMEYIGGDDLGTILEKRKQKIPPTGEVKPFDVDEVMRWAEQLLDALDYLHRRGEPVIHRDIKPANLKLAERGQIILLDFGLAKGKPEWMTRVTTTGSIYGYTPNYAPLEQIRGLGTDPRSDLYALGATLYHLTTGAPPVDAATRADALLGGEPDPLLLASEVNSKVPQSISAVLVKAMEVHRNHRPATAADLLRLLRDAKPQEPRREETPIIVETPDEAETQRNLDEELWQREEAERRRQQQEQERRAKEGSERKRQEEEERRIREEAERKKLQHEEERRAQEESERLRQQREREQKSREEAERRKFQEKEERRAREEADKIERQQEKLRRQREREDTERRKREGKPLEQEKRRNKLFLGIGSSLLLVALLIWGMMTIWNTTDGPTTIPSTPDQQTNTSAPVRLKPDVFTLSGKSLAVSLSDDARVLASGGLTSSGNETAISVWQPEGKKEFSSGRCAAVSRDGKIIASGSEDGTIRLWQAGDGKPINTWRGHSSYIFSIGFSPDGKTLFSASGDRSVKLWRASDKGPIATINTPEEGYLIVAVSPDLKLVGFYRRDDRQFKLWSTDDDSFLRYLEGDVPDVTCGVFSRDGSMLALGSRGGDVRLWRVSDGQKIKDLGRFGVEVVSLALTSDGQTLAAGLIDGKIKLLRASDGEWIRTLEGHTQSVNSLSFSADGRLLASGSDDGTVRLWRRIEPRSDTKANEVTRMVLMIRVCISSLIDREADAMKGTAAIVLVMFALMATAPTMSAQVGRPNEPAKKPEKKPASKPSAKPAPRVARGSAALKELFNSFVQIPAGEFLMGSENGSDDEKPVHRVQISRPFEMGKYEVTQAQWVAMMGSNPSKFKNCGGNCPVENVSWDDVQEFIKKLNARNDGYTYRLPTEAEWEYACRAGSTGDYAGNLDATSWYDKNSGSTTHPVGQKQPNAWGLYDMHGNVCEWCQDWYSENYYTHSQGVDPRGPASGSDKVVRGGGWSDDAVFYRPAYRSRRTPNNRALNLGFRLVRTLSVQTPAKAAESRPRLSTKTVDPGSNPLKTLFNSFVPIPAGEFLMGSENGDFYEKPVHRVRISRPFEMDKYEMTQAQWESVMGSGRGYFKGADLPVENVSWEDVQKFIDRMNARNDGYFYRLPTEAEWEYACRAGSAGDYAGDLREMAWYGDNSGGATHPVGQKKPNAWGLYDMHGNVSEWCQDWYDGSYYAQSPSIDPQSHSGSIRVIRGGSWSVSAASCRSASRDGNSPINSYNSLGFRLVRMLRIEAPANTDDSGVKPPTETAEPRPRLSTKTVEVKEEALKELFNSFVQIPAGEFLMGSENGYPDEKPPHRVRISRPFEMGKYEVTQAQWVAVMGSNPSYFKNCGGNCPVERVSWEDMQPFIQKLNARNDGYFYRLPTEAEWEYACRAGSTGDYAGDLNAMAWYINNSGGKTHPVGQKRPNAWGLYDMHGNVLEWCQDWYDGNYYAQSLGVDPHGQISGSNRVLRGGSWDSIVAGLRFAHRRGSAPADRLNALGFRLVRTLR